MQTISQITPERTLEACGWLALCQGSWLLGSQLYLVGLPWLILQATNSPALLGLTYTLAVIPRLTCTALAGVLCDRIHPKPLIIAVTTGRTVYLASFASCLLFNLTSVSLLIGLACGYGIFEAIFHPARRTALPLLVTTRQLPTANAVLFASEQLIAIVGPVVSGQLIAGLDWNSAQSIGWILGLCAFLTLTSAIATIWLRLPSRPHSHHTTDSNQVPRAFIQGVLHAWHHQATREILLMLTAINLVILSPVCIGLPVLVDWHFSGDARTLGLLMTVLAAGGLLGALAVSIFGQSVTLRRPVFGALGSVAGGALAALIAVPHLLTAILAVFIIGFSVSYLQVSATTWLQHVTPSHLLGRVMGLLAMR